MDQQQSRPVRTPVDNRIVAGVAMGLAAVVAVAFWLIWQDVDRRAKDAAQREKELGRKVDVRDMPPRRGAAVPTTAATQAPAK